MARVLCLLWTCFSVVACTVCPEEWTSVGSKCYRHIGPSMSWEEARKSCLEVDAQLPEITNSEENSSLGKLILEQLVETSWLGIVQDSGQWKYVSNNMNVTFFRWRNGSSGGDCAMVDGDSLWRPYDCNTSQSNVVCQK